MRMYTDGVVVESMYMYADGVVNCCVLVVVCIFTLNLVSSGDLDLDLPPDDLGMQLMKIKQYQETRRLM